MIIVNKNENHNPWCTNPIIYVKMDEYLIDRHFIKAFISSERAGTSLEQFSTINTLVNGRTITGVLCDIQKVTCNPTCAQNHIELAIRREEFCISRHNMARILTLNITKLLAHPDIDFSIPSNMTSLASTMFLGFPHTGNEIIDQILTRHKLNPDVVIGCNSVKRLLFDADPNNERICIYLKHGANMDLNIDRTFYGDQPYIIARDKSEIIDTIVAHTEHFRHLEKVMDPCYESVVSTRKICESILRCGKISALEYLTTNKKNVDDFNAWLKRIRTFDLNIDEMRVAFIAPIQHFELVSNNKNASDAFRKLMLFKHNLECLTQHVITVPAYKYYDIAIILSFLIKYQHLTMLTCDVLRYITVFVFS